MTDHKHKMIHGWIIGMKHLDWVCIMPPCRAAWTQFGPKRGVWKETER